MPLQQLLRLLISSATGMILGHILGSALTGDVVSAVFLLIPFTLLVIVLIFSFNQSNPTDL
jgi:hypothetical protein